MASEIRINWSLTGSKGTFAFARSHSKQITLTGSRGAGAVQNIGTSYEAVVIPADISTAGLAYFINNDLTNYVDVGVEVSSAFYGFLRLYPGEGFPVRLTSTTIFAKANTAAVDLEFYALQN